MDARELFLTSDATLRSVIDGLEPADLRRAVPPEWSGGHRAAAVTLRDIVNRHAYDEAWVPEVIVGRRSDEGEDPREFALESDDPITAYDEFHNAATAAVSDPDLDLASRVHFSYGEYSLAEGLTHLSMYRTFQCWQIAHLLGLDFHLPHAVIAGMNELVMPHAEQWQSYGVFPPAVEEPAGADAETALLCAAGYWIP